MYITSLNNAAVLAPLGIFREVEWTKLLPDRITDQMVEADGVALRYVTTLTHFAYNKNLLPNPPATLQGFLDPKFKGKLATTPYAAGWDAMGASDVWGLKKTVDFARALSGQISGLINCGDENRIATGEFVAMIFTCGGGARTLVEKGAPLGLKVAADMVSTGFFYLLVPKNATSPNAATLATVYLMTDEGQKFSWEVWRDDLHMFPDSKMAGLLQEALVASGGKMTQQTIKWAREHPEKDEALAEVTKIFQTSGKN
jgi:ABC-type Fe3+ transport system substrate-binding protein